MNHTVSIEKIIHGGQGIARLNSGMVVLCPFTMPGEKVLVREVQNHRSYINAELVDIIEPSTDRVKPACPHYFICGGCDFQHMAYQAQIDIKREILRESLDRSNTVGTPSALKPVLPSAESFGYRHRIRLKLSRNGSFGFHETRSNRLVQIQACPVATRRINNALQELKTLGSLADVACYFNEIELLHSPADDVVHAVFRTADGKALPQNDDLAGCIDSMQQIDHVSCYTRHGLMPITSSSEPLLLKQDFSGTVCGTPYSLTWSPDCFFQANASQNCELVSLTVQCLGHVHGLRILDLYCGMGNFSIPIALNGAELLTGIERNNKSLAWAEKNAIMQNISNCNFVQGDVTDRLSRLTRKKSRYDLIVLDPPRQGFGRRVKLLSSLTPERILYISCDPATLTRDIAVLTASGYTLSMLKPVDMFPQTHHIESVALLEKN